MQKIEVLNAASRAGLTDLDEETARWLEKLPSAMADKLASVGLIPKRNDKEDGQDSSLNGVLNRYIATRTDVKSATVTVWKRTPNHLIEFFGPERDIRKITSENAKDFRLYLLGKLADNTVRRTCGIAKQFLEDAIDRELLKRNPFRHRDIPTSTGGNPDREFLITRAMTQKLIEECPIRNGG